MHKISVRINLILPFVFLAFTLSTTSAAEQLDKTRYITIDEIKPGMEAYCLTIYKGVEIEKFNLEVLSVVRNFIPGRDAILVQGTDERFIHSGPVAGCSGSPVYIEGRMAGALSFGWIFSKDPLYGVTPIEEMLRVGKASYAQSDDTSAVGSGFTFDFSEPIDFDKIYKQITTPQQTKTNYLGGATILPCPLITSALPDETCKQLNGLLEPFGLMAVAGISGGSPDKTGDKQQNVKLAPGASLAVPLITGDIRADAIGTVTEVEGDKVYAFGHGMLGYGAIDLPMATSQIHTIVSNVFRSFKFGTSLEIVGALTVDESTGVRGQIGKKPYMIPLKVTIDHFSDTEKRTYNCQLANNRFFTPLVFGYGIAGTIFSRSNLPPDHMIEYKTTINMENAEPVIFENVSSSLRLREILTENVISVAILLNNPYKKVTIKSIDFEARVLAKNILAHIWSVDLADSKVKAGENLKIDVVVESVLADKKKHHFELKVPEDLDPGEYKLVVCGGYEYHKFLRQATPHRFIPQNLSTLIEAINDILSVKRDSLYCLFILPSRGVTVENAELPDLPATKALILHDGKRTLKTRPYAKWLEKNYKIGAIIIDEKTMSITVEK
jgi:hypothetical protein